jgi:hypothetical protein
MNISLEEQIEYMREQFLYFFGHGKHNDADRCKAILATLEAVRDSHRGSQITDPLPSTT